MTNLGKWWKNLPIGIKIVIIIVAIIVVYYTYTYIKSYSSAVEQQSQENAFINQGEQPSFPEAEYESMANELVTSMAGPGTYFDDLKSVIVRLNTNLDAVKLNQAFGQRVYTTWYGGSSTAGLKSWLESDLSASELAEMYQIMQTNGITYKFK